MTGHRYSRWGFRRTKNRWYRHCVIGLCTAMESAARGHRPKEVKR